MDNSDSVDRSSSELGTTAVTNGAPTVGAGLAELDGHAGPPTAASTNEALQLVENVLQSDVRRKLRVR